MSTLFLELTVKPPHSGHFYSGHLSPTDLFLRNGWNGAQPVTTKPLCSGYFIANTSLQWTSFLAPKSPYPLKLTSR